MVGRKFNFNRSDILLQALQLCGVRDRNNPRFLREQTEYVIRRDRARSDDRRANVVRFHFLQQRFGEHAHCKLARGIGCELGADLMSCERFYCSS